MEISALTNSFNNYTKNILKNKKSSKNTSFGSIYIEDSCRLGKASLSQNKQFLPKFFKSDALLLNDIAQHYPNQDCFIRKGALDFPRLEYREKPPEVQIFTSSIFKPYRIDIDPYDKEYPAEPLLLYDKSERNCILGLSSYISLNPSLSFTVKAGYELHKKLIEKKYQIKDMLGRGSEADLGEENLIRKAHKEIEDVEVAVTRYLLESAYAVLSDKPSAKQIYASNYPKVQSRLDEKRRFDLTTSLAKQNALQEKIIEDRINSKMAKEVNDSSNEKDKKNKSDTQLDICAMAMAKYPNKEENIRAIQELETYMLENNLTLV